MDSYTRGNLEEARLFLRSASSILEATGRRLGLDDELRDSPATAAEPASTVPPAGEADAFTPEWFARHPELQSTTIVFRVRDSGKYDLRVYASDGTPCDLWVVPGRKNT
jgi:hypothetical protein